MTYSASSAQEAASVTAFFTGHRIIPEADRERIMERLDRCILSAYSTGYRKFFCGCALGFDTLAACRVLSLKEKCPEIILSLAVPCATQADRWTEDDRKRYLEILQLADEKTVLSPVYYRGAMMTRNRYMADRSSLCICYLTQMRGGTASTVRYALQHDRIRIINLAVRQEEDPFVMREETWNAMFISRSVYKNAVTAPLCLSPERMRSLKPTSVSS